MLTIFTFFAPPEKMQYSTKPLQYFAPHYSTDSRLPKNIKRLICHKKCPVL